MIFDTRSRLLFLIGITRKVLDHPRLKSRQIQFRLCQTRHQIVHIFVRHANRTIQRLCLLQHNRTQLAHHHRMDILFQRRRKRVTHRVRRTVKGLRQAHTVLAGRELI